MTIFITVLKCLCISVFYLHKEHTRYVNRLRNVSSLYIYIYIYDWYFKAFSRKGIFLLFYTTFFTIFSVVRHKHKDTYIWRIRYCNNLPLDILVQRIYTCQDLDCHFQLFQGNALLRNKTYKTLKNMEKTNGKWDVLQSTHKRKR